MQVPESLHELIVARVAAVPAETRAALLAAAALADPTPALIGAAIGGDGAAALGPAVDAELVTVGAGRVRFTHPLLAAAAYAGALPAERRDVHAALAAHVRPEERARHVALAADGPDAEVAAALDEAARRASARGAPDEAAELLEEAQRLTPTDTTADALRRAVDAAGYHFEAGDARRARVLLDDAIAQLPAGVERARALIVLARVRSYDDDIRAAVELLEAAVAEGVEEPLVQGRAHEILSGIFFRLRERLADAVAHANAALELAERHDDAGVAAAALGSLVLAEAALGSDGAPATFAAAEALGSSGRGSPGDGRSRVPGRRRPHVVGAARRREDVVRADARGRRGDRRRELCPVHPRAAGADRVPARPVRRGGGARERGSRARGAGRSADARRLRACAPRARGRAPRRRRGRALGDGAGARAGWQYERPARRALRDGGARAARALARPVRRGSRRPQSPGRVRTEENLREPGVTRFVPDLVEALIACERLDEAEEHLGWFEANAERLERASGRAASARCRALLAAARGDVAGALTELEHAIELHDRSPIPFDRARTLLALGVARRRANERREARTTLEEARRLPSLGATLWSGTPPRSWRESAAGLLVPAS